jgi:hypothetical protein
MNGRFEYKGYAVEITSDPVTIIADGRDYTPFWNGKDSPEAWIKGMLDARRRSQLERTIRDLVEKTKKEGPDDTAKHAEIATVPDESKRPDAPEARKRIVGPRMFINQRQTNHHYFSPFTLHAHSLLSWRYSITSLPVSGSRSSGWSTRTRCC